MIKVKIDSREPKTIISAFKRTQKKLKTEKNYKNIDFEIGEPKVLLIGDFVCEEKGLVIERKEIGDYISSMRGGHLYKQLLQQQQFPHSILIIVGSHKSFQDKQRNALKYGGKYIKYPINQHNGSLASIYSRFKIPIIFVENNTQYADLCLRLSVKINDGKQIELKHTELLKNSITTDDMKLKILTCFEGIGLVKATKILKEDFDVDDMLEDFIKQFENKYLKKKP